MPVTTKQTYLSNFVKSLRIYKFFGDIGKTWRKPCKFWRKGFQNTIYTRCRLINNYQNGPCLKRHTHMKNKLIMLFLGSLTN